MDEEKLREEVAQHLYDAVFPGADWNELSEYEKEPFYDRADQIHELYKKYTWLKGEEKLPYFISHETKEIERLTKGEVYGLCQVDTLKAGFKSTEEWKK